MLCIAHCGRYILFKSPCYLMFLVIKFSSKFVEEKTHNYPFGTSMRNSKLQYFGSCAALHLPHVNSWSFKLALSRIVYGREKNKIIKSMFKKALHKVHRVPIIK